MKETIGNRIAKYRKEKGVTQEELATVLGVSPQAVSKWETDVSCPDVALIPELCKALGITADELLTGDSDVVRVVPAEQRKNLEDLILRVRMDTDDGDRLRVNLPMGLVRISLQMGVDIAPKIGHSDAIKEIDWNLIVKMAENGTMGKILEMESSDGDKIEVTID